MPDDLERTKLCAEAMGYVEQEGEYVIDLRWQHYDPLLDDAQAMALVKRFPLLCLHAMICELAKDPDKRDFNRAAVVAVSSAPPAVIAEMQSGKENHG